jgi:predicted alpha/beta-hydrolase family hydrolase
VFGTPADVESYKLSDKIEILWLEDGDHGLKPRKTISGFSEADHMTTVAERVVEWSRRL